MMTERAPYRPFLLLLWILLLLAGCEKQTIIHGEISPLREITSDQLQNIDSVVLGAGQLYVSDIQSVKVFDLQTGTIISIGEAGTGDGQFTNEVIGLAINSHDELYAVDQDRPRILVFDRVGTFLREFGVQGRLPGQFMTPQGIVIDDFDLVYISDKSRNDVQVFSRGGEFLYGIGQGGSQQTGLNEPESMAIRDNRLYVADEENRRVQMYTLRGEHLGSLPHSGVFGLEGKLGASLDDIPHDTNVEHAFRRQLSGDLEGLAFDDRGLLYVLDEDDGRILVFQAEVLIGVLSSTEPILSGDGMAFDPELNHLYVVDQGNTRVQVFDVESIHRLLKLAPSHR